MEILWVFGGSWVVGISVVKVVGEYVVVTDGMISVDVGVVVFDVGVVWSDDGIVGVGGVVIMGTLFNFVVVFFVVVLNGVFE